MPLPVPLSDARIAELIGEAKAIPEGLTVPLRPMLERNQHFQRGFEIDCPATKNKFVVKIRLSCINPMNFSVILGYMLPSSYTIFRLRRYNGKSHEHENVFEKEKFYDFHVHQATERYQISGFNEDHFAVRTNRYYDIGTALKCLLNECGFPAPHAGTSLFPSTLFPNP